MSKRKQAPAVHLVLTDKQKDAQPPLDSNEMLDGAVEKDPLSAEIARLEQDLKLIPTLIEVLRIVEPFEPTKRERIVRASAILLGVEA